jgi:acyl-coenzyme A synthetase/AMP-(fatty) acid ligase
VKIRGFRIELGEIETVLARHPAVGGAAVLVREDRPGDRRLVAYVATRGGETAPAGELRDHLRRTLPEYMIPVAWVFLAALPVTANGKLDRGALPPPERQQAPDRQPPSTPTEQALAAIWQEVLGVAEVCRDDNFFDLGGHSLLATRLASRLRDAFAVETRLRVLFVSPTLAAMAEQIEELLLAGSSERSVDGMLDALESLDDEAAAEMLRRGGLPQSLQGRAR